MLSRLVTRKTSRNRGAEGDIFFFLLTTTTTRELEKNKVEKIAIRNPGGEIFLKRPSVREAR